MHFPYLNIKCQNHVIYVNHFSLLYEHVTLDTCGEVVKTWNTVKHASAIFTWIKMPSLLVRSVSFHKDCGQMWITVIVGKINKYGSWKHLPKFSDNETLYLFPNANHYAVNDIKWISHILWNNRSKGFTLV